MSISGNPGNGSLSFSFAPPSHQATMATVVHTGAPTTIPTRRRDGEEAESSSSDHTIPRVSVQPTNILPPVIPFSSGVMATSTLTFPYGMSSPLLPPYYLQIPFIPPFNHTPSQTSVYTNPLTPQPSPSGSFVSSGPNPILNLKRGPIETVEEFIVKYNLESIQINGTTEALKVAGFIHGWEGRKAERKGGSIQAPLTPTVRKSSVETSGRPAYHRRDSGRYTPYTHREVSIVAQRKDERHETYPTLTKTPSEISRTKGLKWEQPRPLKDNPARDKSKYCDYHRVHGHDTNDCWHLKNQIEKFYSNGELKHLIEQSVMTNGFTASIPKKILKGTGEGLRRGQVMMSKSQAEDIQGLGKPALSKKGKIPRS
ncbi:hypothetical protein E3N88_09010 [Mikania micrantha]|uniref:Retrotransposon gag domain-containing protein n=1 Tax=Mikania micrantha TaxID=192012 RepID=A0A5N6PHX6_9ASTR|nr:hypothetical protein E3N88_09010 [Mikania micrantha]